MDTTTVPAADSYGTAPGEKGLKPNAIGYISNLVIAVASTAPAYSLAATLGFIVAVTGVGAHAPAVLIVSFIPILSSRLAIGTSTSPTPTREPRLPGSAALSAPSSDGSTAGPSSSPTSS
jgi:hypothetical protein